MERARYYYLRQKPGELGTVLRVMPYEESPEHRLEDVGVNLATKLVGHDPSSNSSLFHIHISGGEDYEDDPEELVGIRVDKQGNADIYLRYPKDLHIGIVEISEQEAHGITDRAFQLKRFVRDSDMQ